MHEVINFSCSQASGHLITQLYNVQESHLAYSRHKALSHQNDVFLVPRKVKGKTNYYPRSINVEFQGGFGYLGKYAYHEGPVSLETYDNVIVKQQPKHEKNQFQVNLDSGKPTDASLLSKENTAHWTDYNKLIYRPESLISLDSFSHPEGTHKNFPRLKFDNFHVGEDEFKASRDEIDDFFRKNLEQSDQVQGVSFFTECDSAWAGFTSDMLVFLRDEYFGNGVSSKYNLWTYGLMSPGVALSKTDTLLTRIRAMTEFSSNSTLFMPLSAPKTPGGLLSPGYDSSKMWHRGAVQSLFVNSIWGLNCQANGAVSMATIENSLLRGNGSRNIVNQILIKPEEKKASADFGMVMDVNISDMYLHAGSESSSKLQKESSSLSLGFTNAPGDHTYARGVICKKPPESGVSDSITDTYVNAYMDEVTKIDTFPPILENNDFSVEFSSTKALKPVLKEYRNVVQRARLPQHMEILGDKGEVIESISSLMEEYTNGYSDESDYDD